MCIGIWRQLLVVIEDGYSGVGTVLFNTSD